MLHRRVPTEFPQTPGVKTAPVASGLAARFPARREFFDQQVEKALRPVVDRGGDIARAQGLADDRLDPFPFPSGETAPDAGHVHGGVVGQGVLGYGVQTSFQGLVADGRTAASGPHPTLCDHVRNPDVGSDVYELHRSEGEVVARALAVPAAVLPLRFGPAT